MELLRNLLLILAYSLGIATLIVQVICYLKKIEYKETIFLTLSFLLVIIANTVSYFISKERLSASVFLLVITSLSTIMLGISVVANAHRERIVPYRKNGNYLAFLSGGAVMVASMVAIFSGEKLMPVIIIGVFLFVTIEYSMWLIVLTKPSALIKERDKAEKRSAWVVAIVMIVAAISLLLAPKEKTVEAANQYGAFILAGICIFLTMTKLPVDIKKLAQFSKPPMIDEARLDRFNITPREMEVARKLTEGKSYREIGEELFISMPTVKTHVSHIYEKLNVKNRHELTNILLKK